MSWCLLKAWARISLDRSKKVEQIRELDFWKATQKYL